jgi:hypothetical protein
LSNYEIISDLEKDGKLRQLVVSGFMPVKIFTHLEVYRFIDMRIKTGSKKMEAVAEASISFNVCESSVFKIIRCFKD